MRTALFWLGALITIGVPIAALRVAKRRLDLDDLWYRLAIVGLVAAVVAMLARDILFRILGGFLLPEVETRGALMASWGGLLLLPILAAVPLEAAKVGVIRLSGAELARLKWPLYGVGIGAGAGLLTAIHLMGATAWTVHFGGLAVPPNVGWLQARLFVDVAANASFTALALYFAAQKKWVRGVALSSAIHAGSLTAGMWLQFRLGFTGPWIGLAVSIAALGVAAGTVLALGKMKGWPV